MLLLLEKMDLWHEWIRLLLRKWDFEVLNLILQLWVRRRHEVLLIESWLLYLNSVRWRDTGNTVIHYLMGKAIRVRVKEVLVRPLIRNWVNKLLVLRRHCHLLLKLGFADHLHWYLLRLDRFERKCQPLHTFHLLIVTWGTPVLLLYRDWLWSWILSLQQHWGSLRVHRVRSERFVQVIWIESDLLTLYGFLGECSETFLGLVLKIFVAILGSYLVQIRVSLSGVVRAKYRHRS